MDRKEYENLEILEGSQTDVFETDSSSQTERISQYEETESECLEDFELGEITKSWKQSDEHESSICSESVYGDEHDSHEHSHKGQIIKNEDQDILEMLPVEEMSEEQEQIQEEEEEEAAETEEDEGGKYGEESVKLSIPSVSENNQKIEKLDSVRGSEIHSRPESNKFATDSSSTVYMSVSSPSTSNHSKKSSETFYGTNSILDRVFTLWGRRPPIKTKNKKSPIKPSVNEKLCSESSGSAKDCESGTAVITQHSSSTLDKKVVDFGASNILFHFSKSAETEEELKKRDNIELDERVSKCPYGSRSLIEIRKGIEMKDDSEESAPGPHTGLYNGSFFSTSEEEISNSVEDSMICHSITKQFIGENKKERMPDYLEKYINKKKTRSKFQCTHTSKWRYKNTLNTSKSTSVVKRSKLPIKRTSCSNRCFFYQKKMNYRNEGEVDSEKKIGSQKRFKKQVGEADKKQNIDWENTDGTKGSAHNSTVMSTDSVTADPNATLHNDRSRESNHDTKSGTLVQNIWQKINLQRISAATRKAMRKWFYFDFLAKREKTEKN